MLPSSLLVLLLALPAAALECDQASYDVVQFNCSLAMTRGSCKPHVDNLRHRCAERARELVKGIDADLKSGDLGDAEAKMRQWDQIRKLQPIRAPQQVKMNEDDLRVRPGTTEMNEGMFKKRLGELKERQDGGSEDDDRRQKKGVKTTRHPQGLGGGGALGDMLSGEDDAPPSSEGLRSDERELYGHPDTPTTSLAELGRGYLRAGSMQDAERVLDRVAGRADASADALTLHGAAKAGLQKWGEAESSAAKALQKDPGHAAAGELLAFAKSMKRTIALEKPLKVPGFGEAGAAGAGAPAAAGGTAPAKAEKIAAVGLPGSPAQTFYESALRKLAIGDFKGALFDVSRSMMADPKNGALLALRSHISNRMGNHEAAIKDAEEALRLEPGNTAAKLERAYALIETGRAAEALTAIEDVLITEPANAMGHLYRGMALLKLGRAEDAASAFAEAVRLDPALRPLTEGLLPASQTAKPGPGGLKLDKKKGLWLLCGLMALLLLMEGGKRLLKPNWSTTAPPAAAPPAGFLPSAGTLAAGATLGGNYRLERELARGGMGVVYEATDLTLKRSVAVKQLRSEAAASPAVRERFLHEARLAAKLRHPNLAQIFNVISEGELYLVFEFLEGESLDRLLARKGRLTLSETLALLKPLCAALDYAHGQKVIHRDLKPGNVLVCADGTPKLMDFGIAHEARGTTLETRTEAWGTPPYMAPEQENGVVSRLSDLYSLAVMAYELLAGRRPFLGGLADKLAGRFDLPSAVGLSRELDGVFRRALDPDAAKRFPTAAAFLEALAEREATPSR